jgi:hypothetical protein
VLRRDRSVPDLDHRADRLLRGDSHRVPAGQTATRAGDQLSAGRHRAADRLPHPDNPNPDPDPDDQRLANQDLHQRLTQRHGNELVGVVIDPAEFVSAIGLADADRRDAIELIGRRCQLVECHVASAEAVVIDGAVATAVMSGRSWRPPPSALG